MNTNSAGRPQDWVFARDIRFSSLEDDGALTICLNIRNETANILLLVVFHTCRGYSLTKFRDRRSEERGPCPWLRSKGLQHLIVAQDRLIEVSSDCKPSVRVLGSRRPALLR